MPDLKFIPRTTTGEFPHSALFDVRLFSALKRYASNHNLEGGCAALLAFLVERSDEEHPLVQTIRGKGKRKEIGTKGTNIFPS